MMSQTSVVGSSTISTSARNAPCTAVHGASLCLFWHALRYHLPRPATIAVGVVVLLRYGRGQNHQGHSAKSKNHCTKSEEHCATSEN